MPLKFPYKFLRSTTTVGSESSSARAPRKKGSEVRGSSDASSPTSPESGIVVVHLRVEGAHNTIFEGPVTTSGHAIHLPGGSGNHGVVKAKERNKPYHPSPTGALDDAGRLEGFDFDGNYSPKYDDIFITRIADTAQDNSRFWGILLNDEFIKVGGCQQRIEHDDNVLFAFDAFNKTHILHLSGPTTTTVGVPVTVTVVDRTTKLPLAGATVNSRKTDEQGHATLMFRSPGVHRLKAHREHDSIRSNALYLTVLR